MNTIQRFNSKIDIIGGANDNSSSSSDEKKTLGYAFPKEIMKGRFFKDFVDAFVKRNVTRFTDLQMEMLDEMLKINHFQVTSPDASCGAGKTSLTVGASIALLQPNDKLVIISNPSKSSSALSKEMVSLVREFSGGKASLGLPRQGVNVSELICNDVIIANTLIFEDIIFSLIDDIKGSDHNRNIKIIFDESHIIFNRKEFDKLVQYLEKPEDCAFRPYLSMIFNALTSLQECSQRITWQVMFLSAVGDFPTEKGIITEDDWGEKVIEIPDEDKPSLIIEYLNVSVTKLVSAGRNSEKQSYIFNITRNGCEHIGGKTARGDWPKVYETMLALAFNWLVEGRLLFVIRRSQLATFCSLLDHRIAQCGRYYMYTHDKNVWNARDRFNIVIVCDDELSALQGCNLEGLRAVYLFTVGSMHDLFQKMQALGRVGRQGQAATYQFVFFDKSTRINAAREEFGQFTLEQALNSNSEGNITTLKVDHSRVLYETLPGLPVFQPEARPPDEVELADIVETVRRANLPQVCKYLIPGASGSLPVCRKQQEGQKCHWYHPTRADISVIGCSDRANTLKAGHFCLSYCNRRFYDEPRLAQRDRARASTLVKVAAQHSSL